VYNGKPVKKKSIASIKIKNQGIAEHSPNQPGIIETKKETQGPINLTKSKMPTKETSG